MGIHDHAVRDVEDVSEDDVRGLPAHARECGEFLHRLGNIAAVIRHQRGAAGAEVFRFCAKEAGGLDEFFQARRLDLRVIARRAADAEKFLRHEIHAFVGALRGEDRGDEKLQRVREIEFAMRFGIDPRQRFHERRRSLHPRHFFAPCAPPRAWIRSFAFSACGESGYFSTSFL